MGSKDIKEQWAQRYGYSYQEERTKLFADQKRHRAMKEAILTCIRIVGFDAIEGRDMESHSEHTKFVLATTERLVERGILIEVDNTNGFLEAIKIPKEDWRPCRIFIKRH